MCPSDPYLHPTSTRSTSPSEGQSCPGTDCQPQSCDGLAKPQLPPLSAQVESHKSPSSQSHNVSVIVITQFHYNYIGHNYHCIIVITQCLCHCKHTMSLSLKLHNATIKVITQCHYNYTGHNYHCIIVITQCLCL